jgi:hypothetical protein
MPDPARKTVWPPYFKPLLPDAQKLPVDRQGVLRNPPQLTVRITAKGNGDP